MADSGVTVPLGWYRGPTWWNPNPGHMWHTECPDLVRSGHDGLLFFWPDGTVSCAGCGRTADLGGHPFPVTAVTLL